MLVRVRDTGAVMYLPEWEAMYPNTSFPNPIPVETLNEFGADVVLNSPTPTLNEGQEAVLDGAVFQDGNWYTTYKIQG